MVKELTNETKLGCSRLSVRSSTFFLRSPQFRLSHQLTAWNKRRQSEPNKMLEWIIRGWDFYNVNNKLSLKAQYMLCQLLSSLNLHQIHAIKCLVLLLAQWVIPNRGWTDAKNWYCIAERFLGKKNYNFSLLVIKKNRKKYNYLPTLEKFRF